MEDFYQLITLDSEKQIDKEYSNFTQWVILGNAVMSHNQSDKISISDIFKSGVYGAYYLFNKKSRIDQHNYFFANPKLEITKSLFMLLEKDYVTKAYNIQMPTMKLHRVLFIPKTENNFTSLLEGKKIKNDDFSAQNTMFHCKKDIFDSETHVKVRLL